MNYGLPYMGSKNKIAEWIVEHLPEGGTLYDLFCGGCAVTHCALLSGKWNRVVINDLDKLMPQMFVDAISGKYDNETRTIDRETFFRIKDHDAYAKLCYSFGNRGETYCLGGDD